MRTVNISYTRPNGKTVYSYNFTGTDSEIDKERTKLRNKNCIVKIKKVHKIGIDRIIDAWYNLIIKER